MRRELRDGVDIAGATALTYQLGPGDVGCAISVRASYVDDRGQAESVTSQPTAGVRTSNMAPVLSLGDTVGYTEGAAAVRLDADATAYDHEHAVPDNGAGNYGGTTLTLARQGGASSQDLFTGLGALSLASGRAVLSGVTVGAASNAGGTLSISFNANATQARVDAVLRSIGYSNTSDAPPASVTLSWTLRDGSGPEALSGTDTSVVVLQNVDDPLTGSVAVAGMPIQGRALGISSTLADKDGLHALSWQWLRDGEAVAGANKSSYALTQADVGHAVAVTVTYTDAYGHAESRTTAATTPVANLNDAPTGGVAITGTVRQGQTVTATQTLGDADGLGAMQFQ